MSSSLSTFLQARDLLLLHRSDPIAAVTDFRWPRLNEFNWALDYFDAMAHDNEATALWIVNDDGSEQRRSFAQLSARSNQVANFLRDLGIKRGERVLMVLGNEPALWETMLAAIKLGAVLIPATTLLTAEDLQDRIERGEVRCIVAAADQVTKFNNLTSSCVRVCVGRPVQSWIDFKASTEKLTEFTPDGLTQATDPMLLYFTSGTTSKPKLVLHTHESYPVGHLSTMYWIGLQPGDVHMNISSPGWAKHAWSCVFAPWNAGACVFIFNSIRFSAPRLLATLASYRVTSLCAPPTVWRMMVQENLFAWRDKMSLRELIGAGEPLNPEILTQVEAAWGLTLRDGYGQTETTAQIGNSPGLPLKPGSMGLPLPGFRIALLDQDGREAEEGEVAIDLRERPTGLMVGYIDNPEKTADVMRGGYYRTGDTATRDADGYLTFVGRADDVFKSSDYRISPFELESVMVEHEAVLEAAVIPSPDQLRLAVPKAFLLLAPGYEPSRELAEMVLTYARRQLAPYKRVRRIEFVDELPKTISGKIRRVQLRARELEHRAVGARGEHEYFEEDFSELKKQIA